MGDVLRRGKLCQKDYGADVERLSPSPLLLLSSPWDPRTCGQSILITALVCLRGASVEPPPPPRPLVDGNTSSAHVIRKQKPVGSQAELEAAAASLQLHKILLHLSSHHHHCGSCCLESCAALPPALAAAQS